MAGRGKQAAALLVRHVHDEEPGKSISDAGIPVP